MARRVAFLGEGPADIGSIAGNRKVPCAFEGDVPRATRKLVEWMGGEPRFAYDAYSIREVVASIPRYGRATRSGGKSKDLRDAIMTVLRWDTDRVAVIAVIDVRLDELDDIRADVRAISNECKRDHPDVPVAIGLAVQEIEAWMLADVEARCAAFGEAIGQRALPSPPESLDDPKSAWAERSGQIASRIDDATRAEDDRRLAAWQSIRADVVAHECPIGFAPFVAAISQSLRELVARDG